MSKRKMQPGEHGEIDAVPLKRVDGKFVKHGASRGADAWRARVFYRGHDGMDGEVSARGKTRKEAEQAAQRKLNERLSGGAVDIRSTTPLLAVGEHWLREISRSDSGLAKRTVESYEGAFRKHVAGPDSSLRGLSIDQANNVHRIKGFLQHVADGSGTGAAKTTKTVVSRILQHALEGNAITINAARQIKPPRAETPKDSKRDRKRSLTTWERDQLIEHADKVASQEALDPRSARKWEAAADLLALLAGTGVRIGEARSLRWEHLHLDPEDGKPYVRLHGTKSKAARRRIDLPSWLAERLKQRIELQRAHIDHAMTFPRATNSETRDEVVARLQDAAQAVGERGYVFGSPSLMDPEAAWDQDNCNKAVRVLLDGAGAEWSVPHSFRRSVATWLGEAGVPLARIADQLGHEDPAMTASVYLGRDFAGDKSDIAALL